MRYYQPCYDYRDPACPYSDDYTPEDEEGLLEAEVDRRIDDQLLKE